MKATRFTTLSKTTAPPKWCHCSCRARAASIPVWSSRGPPALLTSDGIWFLYNSSNNGSDPTSPPGTYAPGWVLFDAQDPTSVIARCTEPFLRPDTDFERSGQAGRDCIFCEGLVHLDGRWLLYYGCGDRFIGVAIGERVHSGKT
jgi:predicted GH43/DUF377 family glycosyl hydrolase